MDDERRNMTLEERLWGYTGAAGLVQALATGYFLFDLVVMIRYLDVFGLGMLAHASRFVGFFLLIEDILEEPSSRETFSELAQNT